ncbi:MAG TPA: tetratricopeptide repeat protein [Geminicoccaceae bacterium]|nr:tetratricopeptide repeat protein [Geminicoccaceae bacterium]
MAAHEPVAQDLAPADEPTAAKRKLAAILSADVKGFSRLMEADEEGTLRTLKSYRATIDALIARHDGRIVGTAGDSVLAEFASPVEAVRCAVKTQEELARRNADLPREHRLEFRIGINLGDVIIDGDDLYGDGVNIAARLQALADPGGILVSGGIYDQIKTKLPFGYDFLGEQRVKNIVEPVRIYRTRSDAAAVPKARGARRYRPWSLAAVAVALVVATVSVLGPVLPPLHVMLAPLTGPPDRQAVPVAARASIAVLPFTNQSDSPADDYFSDGISEDLITALGRFSGLGVMSWNAVAPYKGHAVAAEQLALDLPVRYVVDGSVRRSSDKIRVTARLSDAERGTLLWSERYDAPIDDVFAVQDDITRRIVNMLAVRMNDLEQQRASAKPTDNLDAYDYYLRGRQHFRRFTRSENIQAREMFEKALELDHEYADAYAALAWTYSKAAEMGWTEWGQEAFERAHDLAQAALRLDPSNGLAHVLLALVHTYRGQYELALAELDRATEANPSHAGYNAERGWVLLLAGRSDEAIEALEEVMRYDPNPTPNTFNNLAMAYYLRERHAEAIVTLEGAIGRHPQHVPLHIALTAAYAAAGRADDAKRAAGDVRRLNPFFEAGSYGEIFRDPATREHIRDDLRKAGL